MFNPCTDQEHKGKRISCYGRVFYDCRGCELVQLKRENEQLKTRIRTELEPRLEVERRSYDRRVTNIETTETK
jgi:Zn-finger protein